MDFELTGEQRLLQETVRSFVDDRILPVAVQNDIDHKLDLELIQGMAELGILGIVIPEEYGGAGLDFVSEALACEEIERGEAAFRAAALPPAWPSMTSESPMRISACMIVLSGLRWHIDSVAPNAAFRNASSASASGTTR